MEKPNPKDASSNKRAVLKDRLGIAGVILALLLLGFMMVDGAVMNFQCSFTEFVTFKCNRWDAAPKHWDQVKHRP